MVYIFTNSVLVDDRYYERQFYTATNTKGLLRNFASLSEAQRDVIALLDAAADENGFAVLVGLGEREGGRHGDILRYWIDDKVI